jgi:hypothetical protein
MDSTTQPSAIERARIAYEQMMLRQRETAAARRLRERRRTIRRAVICGAIFALLLGVVIYNGWMPDFLQSTFVARDGAGSDFGKSRVGQVRSFVKGDTCRELRFDNTKGVYVGGSFVECETVVPKDPGQSSAVQRVFSIRNALTR